MSHAKLAQRFDKFTEDELKILHYILNTPNPIYQSRITKETNLTKVKTSRIIRKFEITNLIKKKRYGMTNIIILDH